MHTNMVLMLKPWDIKVGAAMFHGRSGSSLRSILLAAVATLFLPALGNKRGFKCTEENLNSICLPDNYSKFELPYTEQTNNIYISIDIDEVLRINDGTYSITFSTYFNVEWKERRLNVGPEFGASLR